MGHGFWGLQYRLRFAFTSGLKREHEAMLAKPKNKAQMGAKLEATFETFVGCRVLQD